jgi:23S rRNA pseudouridine1911/1915/1917 synthase
MHPDLAPGSGWGLLFCACILLWRGRLEQAEPEQSVNQGWTYHDHIDKASQDWTVLDYYTQRYPHSSRSQWQQRIEAGQILLNGAKTNLHQRLQAGQRLTYDRCPWEEPEVPLSFAVLHEDADLLVVAKPSGLPVLPGGGFLQHTLLWQLQQRYPQEMPYPIHRLGRGTSGLMLLARSPRARASLSQQMRDRQIEKIYRTRAQGCTMPDRFTVTQAIGKVPYPILGYVYAAHPDGLSAQSDCRVVQRASDSSLLDVQILTGRPHQIRIHLAAAGFPLVGDSLYTIGGVPKTLNLSPDGELAVPGDCGYFLHAMRLRFRHPKGEEMTLTLPPIE